MGFPEKADDLVHCEAQVGCGGDVDLLRAQRRGDEQESEGEGANEGHGVRVLYHRQHKGQSRHATRANLAKADDVQRAGLVTSTEPVAAAEVGLHVRAVPGERLRADVLTVGRDPHRCSRD
jgi:hypothetical protein